MPEVALHARYFAAQIALFFWPIQDDSSAQSVCSKRARQLAVVSLLMGLALARPAPLASLQDDLQEARQAQAREFFRQAQKDAQGGFRLAAQGNLEKAIAANPAYLEPRFALASLHEVYFELAEASQVYLEILHLKPDSQQGYLGYIKAQWRLGNFAEARRGLEQLLRIAPNQAEGNYLMARYLAMQGRYAEAGGYIDRGISASAQPLDYQLFRGAMLLKAGFDGEAENGLSLLAEGSPEEQLGLAWAWLRGGRPDEALNELKKLPRDGRFSFDIGLISGRAYSALGKSKEAQRSYQKIFNQGLGRAEVHLSLAELKGSWRQDYNALLEYTRSLHFSPENARAYYGMGQVYERQGKLKEAHTALHQALKFWNFDDGLELPSILAAIAQNNYKLGEEQEALEVYDRLFAENLGQAADLVDSGDIRAGIQDFKGARQQYDAALLRDASYMPAYRQRGRLNWEEGQTTAAVKDLETALSLDENDAMTHFYLAVIYREQEKLKEAMGLISKAIELDPKQSSFLVTRARYFVAEEQNSAAIQDLQLAITLKDPLPAYVLLGNLYLSTGQQRRALVLVQNGLLQFDVAELYELRGDIRFQQRSMEMALADYKRALSLSSGELKAGIHQRISSVLLQEGDYPAAIAQLDKAIALSERRDLLYFRAQALLNSDDLNAALEAFTQIIEGHPGAFAALYQRAYIYMQLRQTDLAESDLHRVLELKSDYALAYSTLSSIRFAQKNYAEAYQYAITAYSYDQKSLPVLYNLSLVMLELGYIKDAAKVIRAILQENPESFQGLYAQGLYLLRTENYSEALSYLDKALIAPNSEDRALLARGSALYALKRYALASNDYTLYLRSYPEDAKALVFRGNTYRELAALEYALRDYNKALSIDEYMGEAYYGRGLLYFADNNYREALTDLDYAERLGFAPAHLFWHRGMALLALGNYEDALSAYDKAISLDSKLAAAYRSRSELKQLLGSTNEAKADLKRAEHLEARAQ